MANEKIEYSNYGNGGKTKKNSLKDRAIDLLKKNVHYKWRNTDMGSGWYFTLESPNKSRWGGNILDTKLVLDIFEGEGKEEYEEWKEEMFDVYYGEFIGNSVNKFLDVFIEYIQQRDEKYMADGGMTYALDGGEADTEMEDNEMEEEKNERLQELMDEYDLPAEVIEEYASNMGVEIVDIIDLPFSGRYDSKEDFARDMEEQGAISDLSYYLYMTSTDMRLMAGEESDNRVDDMSDSDLLYEADLKNDAVLYKETQDKIDDLESEIDGLRSNLDDYLDEDDLTEGEIEIREQEVIEIRKEIEEKEHELKNLEDVLDSLDTYEEIVDKARERVRADIYDDIYDELEKDAVGYFVNNLGYAEKDLVHMNLFSFDYQNLASDLSDSYTFIEHDGDVYVFASYMDGGMTYAKGGGIPKSYNHFIVRKSDNKIISGYDYKGVDKDDIKYYTKEDFKDMGISSKDFTLLTKQYLMSKGINPYDESNWTNSYADGGMTYAKNDRLSIFAQHQIKIAKDTLKMSDKGAIIMGGMTKEEAIKILKKYKVKMDNVKQFAFGGVPFDDKVKAIKKTLQGTKVAPKYRDEYGKTYDKKEALSAAKKIAGTMKAKEMAKKKS